MFGHRKNQLPMIYQAESSECSLACLAMICGYYGLDVDMVTMRDHYSISLKGATLKDIVELASLVGLTSRPVRCEIKSLGRLKKPALLHWDLEHFVVLKSCKNGVYKVHDPALGVVTCTESEFSQHFTGIAVEFRVTDQFQKASVGGRLTLPGLFNITRGVIPMVGQVIWLTTALELFALLGPYLIKVIVDTGISNHDFDFVTAIVIGLIGIALMHGLMFGLRNYLVLYFGARFNLQIMSSLFRHMLRLPMSYYIKRMTGDLIDRYQSTDVLRRVVTSDLPSIFLDGVVSLISLVVIYFISPTLCFIALAGFVAYLSLRLRFYRPLRELSEKAVKARSEENAHVIDSLRGMQPIKIFSKENERLNLWSNHYAKLVNADLRLGLMTATLGAAKIFILGIDTALSIYFGARLVADGNLTIGILFAFFVYKAHFTQRASILAERLMELKLVDIHLERLSDIALSKPEKEDIQAHEVPHSCDFEIEFRNVSFRYAPLEPNVVEDVSLTLKKGDFVAIIGPSGSGKTTLFKLMLGLIKPTHGQILFNGKPIETWNLSQYRQLFGVVMQEDQLLSGSMIDNIAFFEASPDEKKVEECAKLAMIWDDIDALPMKLNSRIGDLGSALSGGQKQRVLLARALYHNPQIMLMDEGTANLDQTVEKQLLDNMESLGLTFFAIAHRPETIRRANRLIHLANREIQEQTQDRSSAG